MVNSLTAPSQCLGGAVANENARIAGPLLVQENLMRIALSSGCKPH